MFIYIYIYVCICIYIGGLMGYIYTYQYVIFDFRPNEYMYFKSLNQIYIPNIPIFQRENVINPSSNFVSENFVIDEFCFTLDI